MAKLWDVIGKAQLLQKETSPATKSSIANQAQRDLENILDTRNFIPEAEQELID